MKANTTPVFEKKWWDKNKPMTLTKTGMGAALARWEKDCILPSKLKERDDFDKAYEAAYNLNSTAAATKKKCGKNHKETADCLGKFTKEIETYVKAVEAEQKKRVAKYKSDRESLRDFVEDGLNAMNDYMSQCNQLAKEVEGLADQAEGIVNTGGNMKAALKHTQDAVKKSNQAQKILEAANKRYEKDGIRIKNERSGKFNANSYGVSKADAEKLDHIFNKTTGMSAEASAVLKDIVHEVDNIKTIIDEANKLVSAGASSRELMLERAESLLKSVKDDAKYLGSEIPRKISLCERIEGIDDKKSVDILIADVRNFAKTFEKRHQGMMKMIGTRSKRIPDTYRSDKDIKKALDTVDELSSKVNIVHGNFHKASRSAEKHVKSLS